MSIPSKEVTIPQLQELPVEAQDYFLGAKPNGTVYRGFIQKVIDAVQDQVETSGVVGDLIDDAEALYAAALAAVTGVTPPKGTINGSTNSAIVTSNGAVFTPTTTPVDPNGTVYIFTVAGTVTWAVPPGQTTAASYAAKVGDVAIVSGGKYVIVPRPDSSLELALTVSNAIFPNQIVGKSVFANTSASGTLNRVLLNQQCYAPADGKIDQLKIQIVNAGGQIRLLQLRKDVGLGKYNEVSRQEVTVAVGLNTLNLASLNVAVLKGDTFAIQIMSTTVQLGVTTVSVGTGLYAATISATPPVQINIANVEGTGTNGNACFDVIVKTDVVADLITRVGTLETTVANHESRLPYGYTLQSLTQVAGYVNKNTGVPVAGGATYKYVEVTHAGEQWSVSGASNGSATAGVIFMNASNAVIGILHDGVNGVTDSFTNEVLTPPVGTVKFYVTTVNPIVLAVKKGGKLNAASTLKTDDLQTQITTLSNSAPVSHWKTKTWAYFGTSIPAGQNSTNNYPKFAADKLGAILTNESSGSSMARRGKIAAPSGLDIYGWAGINYLSIWRSLAMNLTEKQYLIDNWSYFQPLLINSPPATLTTNDQNSIKDHSYENRLVARHLGANRKDLYIFDHGHNDNLDTDSDTQYTTVPASSRDRNTFIGAMNFLIDLILADNPRATICFVGHYENARKTRISVAQDVLAAYWDFPIIRLWERLGITQQPVTTTGYWSDAQTWNASGGSPQTLTMSQVYMQDNLHFLSVPVNQKVGNVISEQMEWIY